MATERHNEAEFLKNCQMSEGNPARPNNDLEKSPMSRAPYREDERMEREEGFSEAC